MWQDWATFESSWQNIFLTKVVLIFGDFLGYVVKYYVLNQNQLLFGQLWDFWLLFNSSIWSHWTRRSVFDRPIVKGGQLNEMILQRNNCFTNKQEPFWVRVDIGRRKGYSEDTKTNKLAGKVQKFGIIFELLCTILNSWFEIDLFTEEWISLYS